MSSEAPTLTGKRRQILQCIEESVRTRGFAPSVREIGEAVKLSLIDAHTASPVPGVLGIDNSLDPDHCAQTAGRRTHRTEGSC